MRDAASMADAALDYETKAENHKLLQDLLEEWEECYRGKRYGRAYLLSRKICAMAEETGLTATARNFEIRFSTDIDGTRHALISRVR